LEKKIKFENIYIEDSDDVSTVVERVLNAENQNLVIFVPNDSKLTESVINLKLLVREAKSAGKKIFLQSESEVVMDMAEEAGISLLEQKMISSKPKTSKAAFFRDIAPPQKSIRRKISSEKEEEIIPAKTKIKERGQSISKNNAMDSFSIIPTEEITARELMKKKKRERKPLKISKKLFIVLGFLFGILLVIFLSFYFLTSADLTIITEKTNWEKQFSVLASKTISENDSINSKIPAQYMKLTRQVNQTFQTTGIKDVSVKSSGKIKIYNAYSSSAQTLIVNTRFLSPDGKIFRITKAVTVPGAKIQNGAIIPSFIEVTVVADQAGEQYNISPTKFSIPGFKGTDKYEKFYGQSETAMSGGYIGEAKVASQADLDKAKNELISLAKISLEEELASKLPEGFKILEDAKVFSYEKLEYSLKVGDKADSFQVGLTGILKVLVFKEVDVKDLFAASAQKEQSELLAKELYSADLQYGVPRVDFDSGILSFPVEAKLIFRERIKTDSFREDLIGMNKNKLTDYLKQIEGIKDINCSITPGFISFLPLKSSNLHISLD
jgi:hypothetical protein